MADNTAEMSGGPKISTSSINVAAHALTQGRTYTVSFKLFLILTFILVGRPQDLFPFLVPLRLALAFTIINLMIMLSGEMAGAIGLPLRNTICKRYIIFYSIMILGIPFAYHRGVAFNNVISLYVVNILFFYMFLVHVDSFKRLLAIIFTVCTSLLLYSTFVLTKGSSLSGRINFGTMYDPNDLAYVFVSLFPLALVFLDKSQGVVKAMAAVVTLMSSVAVVLMTGSRGGLLGLAVVLLLILFTNLSGIRRSYKILLLAILMLVAACYSDRINLARYATFVEIGDDYNVTSEEGRLHIWKRGLKLALSHPITGVGVGCFNMAIGYDKEAVGLVPKWQSAHNSFVEVITETGLIGFTIFISLVLNCFKSFLCCRKTLEFHPELHQLKNVCGLLQIGFVGHLICAFFLTQAYSIFFTLYFAFAGVLLELCTVPEVGARSQAVPVA